MSEAGTIATRPADQRAHASPAINPQANMPTNVPPNPAGPNPSQAPAAKPAQASANPEEGAQKLISQLKVSGHLMTLDSGLYCLVQTPGAATKNDESGLPGVRISPPPGVQSRPDQVKISTFREDGWLGGGREDAALVRVYDGPAQVLVTIYQAPNQTQDAAPRLQVLRLSADAEAASANRLAAATGQNRPPTGTDVVAHVARVGDLAGAFGDWIGQRGSQRWIEGFGIMPRAEIAPEDIEYQAVLGRGWLSPWVEGGKFCGSRGMALPLLGLRARLRGAAANAYSLSYSATFVDGTSKGPVEGGESCEAESLAPLEAFQVVLQRKDGAAQSAPLTPTSADEMAEASKVPPSLRTISRPAKPATPVRRRS
jgi:hypothetical protein